MTPTDFPCPDCGAQPGRVCLPQPYRIGPSHASRLRAATRVSKSDSEPLFDLVTLRRERDAAMELCAEQGRALGALRAAHLRLIEACERASSAADARLAGEQARRALPTAGGVR